MHTANDQKLFETYLAPALRPAYGVAFYLLQDSAAAEALVQDTALRAFLHFSLYQPGTSFTAWFLKRLVQTYRETRHRAGEAALLETWEDLPETGLPALDRDDEVISRTAEFSSTKLRALPPQQIAAAFAQLPIAIRLVVALYFMEELSYAQIADILECPLSNVRAALHRGRWVLHRCLHTDIQARGTAPLFATGMLPA